MNLKTWRRDVKTFGFGFAMGALGRRRWSGDTSLGPLVLRPRDSDFNSFRQCFVDRQYDLDRFPQGDRVRAAYQSILDRGEHPLIVDAGANVGAASLWFATRFPRARIVAVEPDPTNAELTRLNTAGRENIRVEEAAIGARSGAVSVLRGVNDPDAWAVRTVRTEGSGVPVITIRDIIAKYPPPPAVRLFLVKVDVEGFEADLFSAATDWLDEAMVVIVEPHDWMEADSHASHAFQQALAARRFDLLISGENLIYVASK